jgi:NADPH-dependent 2,4-dienoyl-CoA reductase/sulfur reductase-like enzyme
MPSSLKAIVVVGANVAGLRAVESLRTEGFDGSIIWINGETKLPYNRPPLSKEVLTGKRSSDDVAYRKSDYYDDLRLDLRSGQLATSLDLHRQTVTVAGETIDFDGLIIATGASPRTIREFQGLEGVYVMRTIEDAQRIRAEFGENPRVVVVGAGFIGSEVAASARSVGLKVTIIEMLPVPLVRAVGVEMGKVCAKLHYDHGTDLRCATTIDAIEGNGRVERLRLGDGTTIEADLVVIGVGVIPNVGWLADSGLTVASGLVCDATLNAGHPAVYAAGDLVWWPNALFGTGMRCEHWTNSAEQGRLAAQNMLAGRENSRPYEGSCYFWSDQYGSRIQFVGIANGEAMVVQGSVEENRFLALYRNEDRIVGALGMNSPKSLMKVKMMIEKRTGWDAALAAVN